MKDFNAIFKTYSGKFKDQIGLKTELGKKFKEGGFENNHELYYLRMFYSKLSAMQNFHDFLTKIKFNSVLEIGCSTGILPTLFNDTFKTKKYTGIDLAEKSLETAKEKFPNGNFICDDFITSTKIESYDLIVSFDVIDHVYDPNSFLSKIIQHSKKFVYVRSYRGFFPELTEHEMEYRSNEGIYLNNLSVKELEKNCLKNNLAKNNFDIYKQSSRKKVLYDSDLGRFWNNTDKQNKKNLLEQTGFSVEKLDSLPVKLEDTSTMIEKSKHPITPELLGLSTSYHNFDKNFCTIIEITKPSY